MKPQRFKITDDISKAEDRLRCWRVTEPFTQGCADKMMEDIEHVLWMAFRALYGSYHTFDGAVLDKYEVFEDKLTFHGSSYWLQDGQDRSNFKADIARKTEKLLYSFKFYDEEMNQTMFIAKTPKGWVVDRECYPI